MQKYTVKIDDSGTIRWYKEGTDILHREDGPAVEYTYGTKEWYQNGELHRIDGPAIEYSNGDKYWYQNGERHRTDGPAVEFSDGDKHWYQNGKLHRIDGPAIECSNGSKYWYIEGKEYTEAEFNNFINKDTPTCEGKRVIIGGKTYKLILVD